MRGRPPVDPQTRFNAKVAVRESGCWEWTSATSTKGYGFFKLRDGTQVSAHRYAWELEHGPIPDGLYVCHRCDNPPCVRVEHLFLGTQADNIRDMWAKGRHPANRFGAVHQKDAVRRKDACVNGHPREGNTVIHTSGRSRCVLCARQNWKRWSERQKQARSA